MADPNKRVSAGPSRLFKATTQTTSRRRDTRGVNQRPGKGVDTGKRLGIDVFWGKVFNQDGKGKPWTWKEVACSPLSNITLPKFTRNDLKLQENYMSFDHVIEVGFEKARRKWFECPAILLNLKSFDFVPSKHKSSLNSEFKDLRDYEWKRFELPRRSDEQPLSFLYDVRAENHARSSNVYNIDNNIKGRKSIFFHPAEKTIQHLVNTIRESYQDQRIVTAAPVHTIAYSPFQGNPDYIPAFNPDHLDNAIKYLSGNGVLGVTTPCMVTLNANMITPFGFNEQKLGELDIVTHNWNDKHPEWIQKIVVVVPPSAFDNLTKESLITRIAKFETDQLNANEFSECQNYLDSHRFFLTLKTLYMLDIGFFVGFLNVGDAIVIQPGCAKFTFSCTINQSIGMCYYSRKYDQILSQRVECTENCEQMHGAEKAKFSIDDFTSALFRQKSTKDSISQHVVAQDDSDPGESPDDRDSPSSGNDSDKDGPSPGGNSGLGDDDVPGFDVPHSDGNGNPRRDVVQDQAGDDPPSGRCNYPRPDDGLSSSDETDILNDDCINEQFTSLDGSTNTDLNCLATTTLGDVSKYVSGVKRRKHPDNKRRGRKKNKQNKRKLKEQKCCHPFTSFQESGTCIALSKQLCFPSSTFVRAISSHVPNTNMHGYGQTSFPPISGDRPTSSYPNGNLLATSIQYNVGETPIQFLPRAGSLSNQFAAEWNSKQMETGVMPHTFGQINGPYLNNY